MNDLVKEIRDALDKMQKARNELMKLCETLEMVLEGLKGDN